MSEIVETRPHIGARLRQWLKTPWTFVVLIPLAVALLDPSNAVTFVTIAVRAFGGTLPYIVVAVVMIAWMKAAGAEGAIGEVFKGRESRMILLAALFGGLAPFCSCEVIPFIAGLLAAGAPLPAIMAFWLSSPLIDPSSLVVTAGALGWTFAAFKAASAVGLGLFGGFALKALMTTGFGANPAREGSPAKRCGCGPSPMSGRPVWLFWGEARRRATFGSELVANGLMLVQWLALAYVLEAVLISYVPASLIAGAVGGEGVVSIAIAGLVGMPAYLNAFAAPPLVAGLMEQGMSAGAGMAFIVAGAVSSVPAMAAVWSLVRREVFAAYIALGFTGAVIAGLIYELIA